MKKSFALLIAMAALLAACETPADTDLDKYKEKEEKPQQEPEAPKASATSGAASNVNEISATVSGTVFIPEGLVNVEAGIYMGESASLYEETATKYVAETIDANGNFSISLANLKPASTYYYKSYLKADGVSVVGKVKNFKTSDLWVTVTVGDTSNYSMTDTATVTGNLKLQASQAYPVEASLFWGKNITAIGKLVTDGTEIPLTVDDQGNYTAQFGPFEYDATYSYVARATAVGKTSYSTLKSFSTPSFEVTVITDAATNVADTVATLNASYSFNYDAGYRLVRVFLYSTVEGTPQYWIDNNLISEQEGYVVVWFGNGFNFNSTVRKFKPSTTYYYAGAIGKMNDNWEVEQAWFGNVQSFTTTAKQQP